MLQFSCCCFFCSIKNRIDSSVCHSDLTDSRHIGVICFVELVKRLAERERDFRNSWLFFKVVIL